MDVILLSGVVRNRKAPSAAIIKQERNPNDNDRVEAKTFWDYFKIRGLLRNFNLRVHKFVFQWDLVIYLSISMFSLIPFSITGKVEYSSIPIGIWLLYNVLFLVGSRTADSLLPGFGRFKHTVRAAVEDFFSTKLLPVISISFILVILSLTVTGRKLGGPPLCYSSCGTCLSRWSESVITPPGYIAKVGAIEDELDGSGCGYLNGKELLAYYTMAQTSVTFFVTVILAMTICMAWNVAQDELSDRQAAEDWLQRENNESFELRKEVMIKFGSPASSIRPEGNVVWVIFGIISALSFILLGWHNWSMVPPSPTSTLLITLNILTILSSTLMLHLGFFGRVITLYKRNYLRVQFLSELLQRIGENSLDAWWNCRNFVLNDDLALDYDIGGLAVSMTFVINLTVAFVVVIQITREGFQALLEPPGSYCAYAGLYITLCLLKIFNYATMTFEEQFRHIHILQKLSSKLIATSLNISNSQSLSVQIPDQKRWEPSISLADRDNFDLGLDIDDSPRHSGFSNRMDTETSSTLSSFLSQFATIESSQRGPLGAALRENETDDLLIEEVDDKDIHHDDDRKDVELNNQSNDRLKSESVERTKLIREVSVNGSNEARRQTLANMVSQIRLYDPYPCVLGIPLMPALYYTSKFYVFIFFLIMGVQVMVAAFRRM